MGQKQGTLRAGKTVVSRHWEVLVFAWEAFSLPHLLCSCSSFVSGLPLLHTPIPAAPITHCVPLLSLACPSPLPT